MDHSISFRTIARSPTNKKCFSKLTLKKKVKKKSDQGPVVEQEAFQSKFDSFTDDLIQSKLTPTPPFVTRRRLFYKNSPLPFNKDSDSSDQNGSLNQNSNGRIDNSSANRSNLVNELDGTSVQNETSKSFNGNITPKKDEDVQHEDGDITPKMASLMDDLYGNVWRSTPGLFKKKKKNVVPQEETRDQSLKINYGDLISKLNTLDLNFDKKVTSKEVKNVKTNVLKELNVVKSKVEAYLDNKDFDGNVDKSFKKDDCENRLKPNKLDFKTCDQISSKENKTKTTKGKKEKDVKRHQDKDQYATIQDLQLYSFMASLADNIPSWRRCERAKYYIANFKTKKEELASELFKMFNENVFHSEINPDLPIVWSSTLQTTAGRAHNKIIRSKNNDLNDTRRSRVELSNKVVDSPQRLRNTLAHELCHVACWLIDGQLRDGHGPTWKKWTARVLKIYPEIGSLPVRHNLDIHFKYTYKCSKCGYKINRHSKSLDVTKKCCGYCRGGFECIINKKSKDGLIVSTPVKSREVTGFALYVKENYSNVRGEHTPHKDAMKYLGKQYSKMKMNPEIKDG